MSQEVIVPNTITVKIVDPYLVVDINGEETKIPRGESATVSDSVCDMLHWMEKQTGDMGIVYTDEAPRADMSKADYHVLQS